MEKNKIKKIVDKIPFSFGIYIMKDKDSNVIYVGKAKSLRKRVRQYFNSTKKSERIKKMVSLVDDIEYIATKNELEALSLECNYIKEYKPKYNVLLKDDKNYPYIKITIKEKYPTIYITRNLINDKNIYFGPYTDVNGLREVVKSIKEIFPIKRCKHSLNKSTNKKVGPCLYYHIKRCIGPCVNDKIEQEYKSMIQQIILFLEGKNSEIEKDIKKEIDVLINKLEFEKADILKRRLENITKLMEKQNVANLDEASADIIGYIYYENDIYIQIFKIRNNKISKHTNFYLKDHLKEEYNKIMYEVIPRYYEKDNVDIPNKIYVLLEDIEETQLLEQYLSKINNKKVKILSPKKGSKLQLIKMVENNININLELNKQDSLENLTKLLNLNERIESIEAYDISNLKDQYIVGAQISYEESKLNKKKYRKYKIRTTETQNDTKSIYEIISRRLNHEDSMNLPDMFLIDGGINQVRAAKAALKDKNINIYVIGMIKDKRHKTKGIIDLSEKEVDLRKNNEYKPAFNLITMIQDEVHRFVINYHRSLRDKIKK